MRRLPLLLLALALSLGLSAPQIIHAKLVHASAPGCEVAGDNMDQVYIDWHDSTNYTVTDADPSVPSIHRVWIDLWSWRLSHDPGTGVPHCYRAYYGSAWTGDGSHANFTAQIRARIGPASPTFIFYHGVSYDYGYPAYTAIQWGGVPNIVESILLPSGVTDLLYFADYGIFPAENGYLPDADTAGMGAGKYTWTTIYGNDTYVSAPYNWYCYLLNGAHCS